MTHNKSLVKEYWGHIFISICLLIPFFYFEDYVFLIIWGLYAIAMVLSYEIIKLQSRIEKLENKLKKKR